MSKSTEEIKMALENLRKRGIDVELDKSARGYRLMYSNRKEIGDRYHSPKEFNAFLSGYTEGTQLGNLADFIRKHARVVQLEEALGHLIALAESKLDLSEPIEGAEELTNADAIERFKGVFKNQLSKERICLYDGSKEE